MIIKVDKEGLEAIKGLADIALKMGGLNNLQPVNKILASVVEEEEVATENASESDD